MNTKKHARDYIKKLFTQQNRKGLEIKNTEILQNILSYIQDNKIRNICIYENLSDEVATEGLIQELRNQKINVYTPQVIGETEMILIDEEYEHYEKEIDLFIIPGRAFTQS